MTPDKIETTTNYINKPLNRIRTVSSKGSAVETESKENSRRETIDSEYDDDDSVNLPEELPPPPDGGWGWVVVFASFLANMIVHGTACSFSPFLGVFAEHFNEPTGKIAWISSLLAGVYLSSGPIASILVDRFGCRVVCIAGGIIGSAAYASTIFANTVDYLMITQGLIAGFGMGLIYLPAVVCVGYYFETKRALATGIAVSGSGVGTVIFPPVINLLIEHYGWKGANLFIAGLILNCCWMGALMRPLKVPHMKRKDLLHRLAEEKKIAMEIGPMYGSNYLTITHSDEKVEKKLKPGKTLNSDPGVHSHLNLSGYLTPVPTAVIREGNSYHETVTDDKKNNENKTKPSHGYGRVLSSGSMVDSETGGVRRRKSSIKEKKGTSTYETVSLQVKTLLELIHSHILGLIFSIRQVHLKRASTYNVQSTAASRVVMDVLEDVEDFDNLADPKTKNTCYKTNCNPCTQMMYLTLLKNPIFLLLGFANMIGNLGFYTPFVYLPAAAVEMGIDKDSATLLVSIIGITNTIGRVFFGLIADIPRVNALWVNIISIIFSGLCLFLIPFANTFAAHATIAVFFGFFISSYISLASIILVNLLGLGSLTKGFGLLILFKGLASIVGPPLAGSIYDATESYDVSFYFSGVLLFLCGGLYCIIPSVQK